MKTAKQVDILYFDICPTWQRTAERVRQIVAEGGLEGAVSVRLVPVNTDDDVRRLRFLGSPTVRVDGEDVEPGAGGAERVGLQCRLYHSEGRLETVPPVALIRRALGLEPGAGGGAACACDPCASLGECHAPSGVLRARPGRRVPRSAGLLFAVPRRQRATPLSPPSRAL